MKDRPRPSSLQGYRETLRRRGEKERRRRARRDKRARRVAQRAAALLRDQFGARRVAVFGSAAAEDFSHAPLDVDVAVWGLSPTTHLEAVARLQNCSSDFKVDLIRMEDCPTELRNVVWVEGGEL